MKQGMKGMQKEECRMQKSEARGQKSDRVVSPTTGRDGAPRRSPGGTTENSPAFQRWEKGKSTRVPKGRPNLEANPQRSARRSLGDDSSVRAVDQPRPASKFQTRNMVLPLLAQRGEGRGEESSKADEVASDAHFYKAKTPLPAWAGRGRRIVVASYTLHKSILEKIWLERLRQKQLLREGRIAFACASPVVSHDRKLRVLAEEIGEVAGAIDRIENFNPLRQPRAELSEPSTRARKQLCDELTQVAAVAIAWLESLENLAVPSPEGTPDNSPAFQRWVKRNSVQVSKGRPTGRRSNGSAVPSGLDSRAQNPGVKTPGYSQSHLRREEKTPQVRPANSLDAQP